MSEQNPNPAPEIPDVILRALQTPREFYYNLKTGEVTEGPQGSGRHRLGPYPTREAAAEALRAARKRDIAWEEQTKQFKKE